MPDRRDLLDWALVVVSAYVGGVIVGDALHGALGGVLLWLLVVAGGLASFAVAVWFTAPFD